MADNTLQKIPGVHNDFVIAAGDLSPWFDVNKDRTTDPSVLVPSLTEGKAAAVYPYSYGSFLGVAVLVNLGIRLDTFNAMMRATRISVGDVDYDNPAIRWLFEALAVDASQELRPPRRYGIVEREIARTWQAGLMAGGLAIHMLREPTYDIDKARYGALLVSRYDQPVFTLLSCSSDEDRDILSGSVVIPMDGVGRITPNTARAAVMFRRIARLQGVAFESADHEKFVRAANEELWQRGTFLGSAAVSHVWPPA